ncbi:hypothetical protein GCM10023170_024240 [Phytohabitans houttuyneae]|uniref:Uncharacterized protein n=1 Tax=Phytohabitans houttuyneae TaxID=1076126 RepID=A0A6V8KM40_9ACTN|nr:hypothetical protein Phou_071960 [Phytohabitans houttuyneae]
MRRASCRDSSCTTTAPGYASHAAVPARYGVAVIPHRAFRQWVTPDLPLYGNDHERGDFAP